jgi:hypothetical protein
LRRVLDGFCLEAFQRNNGRNGTDFPHRGRRSFVQGAQVRWIASRDNVFTPSGGDDFLDDTGIPNELRRFGV